MHYNRIYAAFKCEGCAKYCTSWAIVSARQAKEALEKADPYMGDWRGDHTYDDGSDSGQIRNIWLVELSRS
jgi:hypothetical protein